VSDVKCCFTGETLSIIFAILGSTKLLLIATKKHFADFRDYF